MFFVGIFFVSPDKTQVFHCRTSKILPPIEFIIGRETRHPGDTCRMFYNIKQDGCIADYLFWDGIVPAGLNELIELKGNEYGYCYYINEDIGLATGMANYRIVLLEKIKKASRNREAFDSD